MAIQETFEEALSQYIEKAKEVLNEELLEYLPPEPPAPYEQAGPPYESAIRLDAWNIRQYAMSIGESNPLFIDPEYGKRTRYGCQIAPGSVLDLIRHGGPKGATRSEGYPLANFFAGTAWDFFDVVRVGSKFRSSLVAKEFIERRGAQGVLLFLITELLYWDFHGDLIARASGTEIMVPREEMGASRAISVEDLGKRMMYEGKTATYTPEQIEEIVRRIEGQKHRGPETLYWEDVEVGDKLGPLVLPPFTMEDLDCYNALRHCSTARKNLPGDGFEPAYHVARTTSEWVRVHPVSRWPWTLSGEHDDPLLAAYRGQPGAFDFGPQRYEVAQQLLTNWMGDDGFIRRGYVSVRKPVYYGDASFYNGEVVKKFRETQRGEQDPGAVPGEVEYCAVGIRIEGVKQTGEIHALGTATAYLPSRESGSVELPVPHAARPPYVPYDTFRKEWY